MQTSASQCSESIYPSREFPEGHPELASALVTCGAAIYLSGDSSSASEMLERAVRMEHQLLFRHLPGLSEAEALNLVADTFSAEICCYRLGDVRHGPLPNCTEFCGFSEALFSES